MSHSVRRHLDVEIDAYDQAIRRFIRGYEDMLAAAAAQVAAVSPGLVLDLGAGTGGLSEVVLESDNVGTAELIDVDPEMMAQAKTRLARFGDRARFTAGSYFDPLPRCDAVSASLSLHHIPDMQTKASLYRSIYEALNPGGVFVNADVMTPSDEPARTKAYDAWVAHNVANGIEADEARRNFELWAEEDTYFPIEVEEAALRETGFVTEVAWQANPSTVLVASKPA